MNRVADSFSSALEHTVQMLFTNARASKWFVLALAAWLMNLGKGGTGSLGDLANVVDFDDSEQLLRGVLDFVEANQAAVIGGGLVAGLGLVGLGMVFQWLWARGEFIFIDGVAQDRAAFVEQWQEVAPQSNQIALFRIVIGLLQNTLLLMASGVLLWHGVGVIYGTVSVNPILIGGVVVGWFVLATAICLPVSVLEVMLAKVMYARRCSLWEGAATTMGLIQRDIGIFVVFLIARMVLGIVLFVASMSVSVILCCVAWVPYISTLILLPMIVFGMAFELHFIAGYGGELAVLGPDASPPSSSQPSPSAESPKDPDDNVWAEPRG